LPESVENKITENLDGWDYFSELDFNVIFYYFLTLLEVAIMLYWLYQCLPCLYRREYIIDKRNLIKESYKYNYPDPIPFGFYLLFLYLFLFETLSMIL